MDPPSDQAEWIEGYWQWDAGRKDFVWVTGTWRVPPPGRFWVNGYWKRDQDGWHRVAGFWSDRKTDRLDYRKDGPPADRPDEDPGQAPAEDTFYIPGQYVPDGNGVVWKKGFWTRTQPGWAWVPAQWVHQPEGWIFQEGFWDRTLEDRGTLFVPAQVDRTSPQNLTAELTYQPYAEVTPDLYGQLNGAFGRPNSNYDGYPGIFYDEDGRFYGYANYGTLDSYYGYLDYPYYGGDGYPYITTPVSLGYTDAVVFSPYGYGLLGNTLSCLGGFGPGMPLLSMSGWGMGGLGWGGMGWGGMSWGWGGMSWGWPMWGWPMWGWGGMGWGWGGMGWGWGGMGWGWGGIGWGGGGWGWGGWNRWCNRYPYHPGQQHQPNGQGNTGNTHGGRVNSQGGLASNGRSLNGNFQHGNLARNVGQAAGRHTGGVGAQGVHTTGLSHHGSNGAVARGVQSPPASRAYGNPFRGGSNALAQHAGNRAGEGSARTLQAQGHGTGVGQVHRASAMTANSNAFRPGFNGVNGGIVHHQVARPAFSTPGGNSTAGAANHGGGLHLGGANGQPMASGVQGHALSPAGLAGGSFSGQGPPQVHQYGSVGMSGAGHLAGAMPGRAIDAQAAGATGLGHVGGGYAGPGQAPGVSYTMPGGGQHAGGIYGGQVRSGGYSLPSASHYGGANLGGGFVGGHYGGATMGGVSGGHYGGSTMGGMGGGRMGGGSMGGMSGGHMGGGGGHMGGGGGHR